MSLLCCFGCLTVFGCRNAVCRKLVFFPPQSMYCVEQKKDGARMKQVMYLMTEDGQKTMPYSSPNFCVEMVKTSRKETIATMHIRYPRAKDTILFSHGNATDLGLMRDHLIDMAMRLEVNVFAYDYCGYGLSSGKSSVSNVLADAEAALRHLRKKWGDKPENIILYGQSLGSGPTLHLASKNPRIKGVVLHAALTSGVRVIDTGVTKTSWYDIFPNIDTIKQVRSPVFVVHGTIDQDINIHHGEMLAEAAPVSYEPFFVEGAGHNNIEVHWRQELFQRVRKFIKFCEERMQQNSAASENSKNKNNNNNNNNSGSSKNNNKFRNSRNNSRQSKRSQSGKSSNDGGKKKRVQPAALSPVRDIELDERKDDGSGQDNGIGGGGSVLPGGFVRDEDSQMKLTNKGGKHTSSNPPSPDLEARE